MKQQRITGHFGVQRDITDLTAAIKALANSEAKYRLLVENQTDVVIKKSMPSIGFCLPVLPTVSCSANLRQSYWASPLCLWCMKKIGL